MSNVTLMPNAMLWSFGQMQNNSFHATNLTIGWAVYRFKQANNYGRVALQNAKVTPLYM